MSASTLREWCRARIAAPHMVHVVATGETREECSLRRQLPAPSWSNRVVDAWQPLPDGTWHNPAFPEVRVGPGGELLED